MALRDILRPLALMALAALLFLASKTAVIIRFDEFLAPVLTAFSVGLLSQALVYIMAKVQFGGSMATLNEAAKTSPVAASIIYASRVGYMVALLVLFTGMLS